MRYEWATTNPIRLVRQSALPVHEPVGLEPVEIQALLAELQESIRTLILIASVTGLRRGELFGLRWEDIDFPDAEIHVVRSMVDQVEGPPKTLASRTGRYQSASELSIALQSWHGRTEYAKSDD